MAVNLLASACSVGDSLLTNKFANTAQVLQQLASEHPGFSANSYDQTIYYGCFQAR